MATTINKNINYSPQNAEYNTIIKHFNYEIPKTMTMSISVEYENIKEVLSNFIDIEDPIHREESSIFLPHIKDFNNSQSYLYIFKGFGSNVILKLYKDNFEDDDMDGNYSKNKDYIKFITFYYVYGNLDYTMINKIHRELNNFKEKIKKHLSSVENNQYISLIHKDMQGLYTSEKEIEPIKDMNIELNYNEGFKEVNDKIIYDLNNESRGLVLLHGKPGTGKTTYIRYLISHVENKEFIYIPAYMMQNISDPEFINFITEKNNAILILEDAERVITKRESQNSNSDAVANILNISDGLLNDILKIQIVCTFNIDKEEIDDALKRSGRLISEWKFRPLKPEKANELASSIYKDMDQSQIPVFDKEVTISEVYNYFNKLYKEENDNSIGF